MSDNRDILNESLNNNNLSCNFKKNHTSLVLGAPAGKNEIDITYIY